MKLWYGVRVGTVMFSAVLFWLSLMGASFEFFNRDISSGLILILFAIIFYLFSRSLEKSIVREDEEERKKKEKEKNDLDPPSGMNFI
jgi:hypothetical protein